MGKWQTLFHPFRAWQEHEETLVDLNSALEREKALDLRIAALEETNATLTKQTAELETQLKSAKKAAEANMHELLRTRREFDEFRHNAASDQDIEAQVKEITAMVEKVEGMKEHYERRIKMLKHALADAKAIIKDRSDYEALHQLAVIDMEAGQSTKQESTDTIENTKMGNKTNSEYYTPSLFEEEAQQEHRGIRVPDLNAAKQPTRDWLQPLPED